MRSWAAWSAWAAGGFAALALAVSAGVAGALEGGASAGAGDDQPRVESLRRFFMSDGDWLSRGLGGPNFGGRVYCGLSVLGSSPDQRRLYLWVYCQEFYRTTGAETEEEHGAATNPVAEGTGLSAPVLAVVSGRGAQTVVEEWRLPGDGAAYAPTLRAMFPEELLEEALAGDPALVPAPDQLRAQAVRELGG